MAEIKESSYFGSFTNPKGGGKVPDEEPRGGGLVERRPGRPNESPDHSKIKKHPSSKEY